MHGARSTGTRELAVHDAGFAQKALERVGLTGCNRHPRHLAFALCSWQASERRVEPCIRACGDRRYNDLLSPLPNLKHDRDVRAVGHVEKMKLAFFVCERGGDRLSGDLATLVALYACRKRLERGVRNV